jgi:ATP-dependent Clp protease protease subunit
MALQTAVANADDEGSSALIDRTNNKVFFYGEVSGESCINIRKALDDAADECLLLQKTFSLSDSPPIELHIQSPGGAVMPTFALVDYIQASTVPIHSYVEGYAGSAATLITCVCQKRFIYPNGLMLLHQLSGGTNGKMSEIQEQVANAELMMKMIKSIYSENSTMSNSEIDELLTHDRWMSSSECMRRGIVDAVI